MSQAVLPLEDRIGYAVKRLQQALRAACDSALRAHGLTTPQYAVLAVLAERPGLSNSELARASFVTRQTMNDITAGLHRAGLVARVPHHHNRRIQQIALTPTGSAVTHAADAAIAAIEQRMTESLGRRRKTELLAVLSACTENLDPEINTARTRRQHAPRLG